ncbi:serine protease [Lithospermum erythrorhizon]|uniref:Serine protease n=1 Tax=Lithospermum erythrorhizon TaxID=34254 RepID=A0AAV3NWT3_LITER
MISCRLEIPMEGYNEVLRGAMEIPGWHYVVGMVMLWMLFLYKFLEFHFFQDLFTAFRGSPVSLTYHSSSPIYHHIVSNCPILLGRHLTTPWLCSPHVQTTFINFFGRPPPFSYRREMFHASDGGTIALDWLTRSDVTGGPVHNNHSIRKNDRSPIMAVIPGLTSDSASPYLQQLAFCSAKRGWDVVIINHRGLGGISITSDCFYNAGWTEDVRDVNGYLHQKYPEAPLFLVGTSIGANILVKYLGEHGEDVPVAGAVAVCSPWDLLIGSRFIARRLVQKLYDRALTIGLQGYAQLHQNRYSRLADWEGIRKSRSIRDFDMYATCLVGKYETVDTYYRRCSSSPYVGSVSVPLLCIGALDDPVCTVEAIPWDECRANKNVVLAMSQHGGHLAFFEGITASSLWWVRAVNEFLEVLHGSPLMHKQKKEHNNSSHPTMQSSIDHAPYISVSDGMVAAMGNEQTSADLVVESSRKEETEKKQEADECISEGTHMLTKEEKSNSYSSAPDSSEEVKKPDKQQHVDVDNKLIRKCLAQLCRHNKMVIWLLMYIAMFSSWPLVGAALKLFGRKAKKGPTLDKI